MTSVARPADRIDRLVLLDWPEALEAPVFENLGPDNVADDELLFIRELSVVADPDDVSRVVREAVAELGEIASTRLGSAVPPDAGVVRFARRVDALATWLLHGAGTKSLPAWVTRELGAALMANARATAQVALVDWPEPILRPLLVLEEHGSLDIVLATFSEDVLRQIEGRLVRELGLRDDEPEARHNDDGPTRRAFIVRFTRDAAQRRLLTNATPVVRPTRAGAGTGAAAPAGEQDAAATALTANADGTGNREGSISGRAPAMPPQMTSQDTPGVVSGIAEAATVQAGPAESKPAVVANETVTSVESGSERTDGNGQPALSPGPVTDQGSEDRDSRPHEHPSPIATREPGDSANGGTLSSIAGGLFLINPLTRIDLAKYPALPDPHDGFGSMWATVSGVLRVLLGEDENFVRDPLWMMMDHWVGASPWDPEMLTSACRPLADALSEDFFRREGEPTLSESLCVPGLIVERDVHIDVSFPLDATNITARRNGLDLDPGWVPGLGRIIRFHYGEQS